MVYVWHKPTELAHCFLFRYCICFCLYDPFNYNLFHKFSLQLSLFSLCSSGLVSASLVLSTVCLFMKVSFSPDIIPSGWLGSKHQFTNQQSVRSSFSMKWHVFWTVDQTGLLAIWPILFHPDNYVRQWCVYFTSVNRVFAVMVYIERLPTRKLPHKRREKLTNRPSVYFVQLFSPLHTYWRHS